MKSHGRHSYDLLAMLCPYVACRGLAIRLGWAGLYFTYTISVGICCFLIELLDCIDRLCDFSEWAAIYLPCGTCRAGLSYTEDW